MAKKREPGEAGVRDPALSGEEAQSRPAKPIGLPKRKGPAGQRSADQPAGVEGNELASPTPATFPIVGIGASAGGLESFTQLLQGLPPDTGMGFVLIQHLSPTSKSLLADILARGSPIPVISAESGMAVEPDHVYVMPAGVDMTIAGGRLVLASRRAQPGRHLPIDEFLRSLAVDRRDRAIGVILSGADSDGVAGLAAIKSEGGVTLVQEPSTAPYQGMPRHAVEAGVADYILDLPGIAHELARLASHPFLTRSVDEHDTMDSGSQGSLMGQVLLLLRRQTGVDFSGYKRATLGRRLARRMLLQKAVDLEAYVDLLRKQPQEVEALYQDILVMVTEFFRDSDTFEFLKTDIFPNLLRAKRDGGAVRMWVVGCSSGQEVYSLAISLLEAQEGTLNIPIQIFGTDINERDIEKARLGLYPERIAKEVSQGRLQRFFRSTTGGYQVNKSVRELCIFARHDLIRDPPFSHMDLVSCRNVMIYFDAGLQQRVTSIFHYALRPHGYLVMGRSESVGTRGGHLFEVVDRKHRVFAARAVPSEMPLELAAREGGGGPVAPEPGLPPHAESLAEPFDLQREADRAIAESYAPASIIVDEGYRVVQIRGRTGPYLEHKNGPISLDLFQMTREGLAFSLRSALEEAQEKWAPVRIGGVHVRRDGDYALVSLEVRPLKTPDDQLFYLIAFLEGPVAADAAEAQEEKEGAYLAAAGPPDETQLLRDELTEAREHLQAVIREKDAGNEELSAAYEEIQSSNEELQSINEELETAKEELQSINEELTTVNEELQGRNTELGRAYDDLSNLVSNVSIPTIVLGSDLTIRRFTPGVEALLNVVPSDVGRRVTDFNLRLEFPDFRGAIRHTMKKMEPFEKDVVDESGRWYSLRIRPYRTADDRIDGAVVSFVDIDEMRRALEAAHRANALSAALSEINSAISSTLDSDEIMARVLVRASEAVGTESASINLLSGSTWVVRYVSGLPQSMIGTSYTDKDLPQAALARKAGQPVAIADVTVDERVDAEYAKAAGLKSQLVVPLTVRDAVIGVMLLNSQRKSIEFTEVQIDFARRLAAAVTLALENARLYQERSDAEEIGRAFGAIATTVIAGRDPEVTMQDALAPAALAVGSDQALAAFLGADGWRIRHVHGLKSELVGSPWGARASGLFPSFASAARPVYLSNPAREKKLGTELGSFPSAASLLLVPLFRRDGLIGMLAFAYASGQSPVPELVEDFGLRLGVALSLGLENARLFDSEHRVAELLRRRVAPALPKLPGLAVGTAVHTAADLEQVGGDFYEVFTLEDGTAAVLIGDVTGKGIEAAVVTETIRSSVRAVASCDGSPGGVLDRVNTLLHGDRVEHAASAQLVYLDQKTGAMRISSGGHPPPGICNESGCRLLEVSPAPPLGRASRPYRTLEETLGREDTLILYTDGVVSARRAGEFFGEGRLLSTFVSLRQREVQPIAQGILEQASEFAGGNLGDDVAIVVVRRRKAD